MNGHTGECSMAMYRGPRVCICGAASRRADHPTRSSDSPDPQDLLDKMIVRRDVPDGEVRFVSEAECITVRSPDSPDPTVRQLAVEIANLAHKGWWTPDNAEFLFTAIEERAKDIIEAEPPPRSPDSVRTPDPDVLRDRIEALCDLAEGDKHQHLDGPDCVPAVSVHDLRAALHPASPPQEGEK
jgi:hypothetical protein